MGLQALLAQQIEGDASEGGDIFWGMVLPDTYEEHRWANVFPGHATFTARTFTKMITIEFAIMHYQCWSIRRGSATLVGPKETTQAMRGAGMIRTVEQKETP